MSKRHFLEFEQPIAELETKIEELRYVQSESAVDISEEIDRLSKKSQQLVKDIYSSLTPWQVTQISRHTQRPYAMDYINEVFTDFQELRGDRHIGMARKDRVDLVLRPQRAHHVQHLEQVNVARGVQHDTAIEPGMSALVRVRLNRKQYFIQPAVGFLGFQRLPVV